MIASFPMSFLSCHYIQLSAFLQRKLCTLPDLFIHLEDFLGKFGFMDILCYYNINHYYSIQFYSNHFILEKIFIWEVEISEKEKIQKRLSFAYFLLKMSTTNMDRSSTKLRYGNWIQDSHMIIRNLVSWAITIAFQGLH